MTRPTSAQKAVEPSARQDVDQNRAQSCLVQIYPPDVVDGMILIESDEVLIGSDQAADLVLVDDSVSPRHAIIRRTNAGFDIQDLGSNNGTLIGSQPVAKSALKPGDTIKIGSFLFKFLSAGSLESQYHETVYSALTRDALTGTMNKRYLMESLGRSIATATRQHHPITVVMIDIDFFKRVNDTHGHLVGDEVLREFGTRLDTSCRRDDLIARYGGEEFCMVLTGTGGSEALEVCERYRRAIVEHPFQTSAGPLNITASFGLATLDPKQPTDNATLIDRADQKLYDAKRAGRDRIIG